MKSLTQFILESMKSYKGSFFGGLLDVVVKFAEVKGNPNVITTRIFMKDNTGFPKVCIPDEVFDKVFGHKLTDEEKRNLSKEEEWKIDFVIDKGNEDGSDISLLFGRKFYHCDEATSYLHGKGFNISAGNILREDWVFKVSKDALLNHPLCLKLVRNPEGWNTKVKEHEEKTIFSIDCSNIIPSGQRKANISGFNNDVKTYLSKFGGLLGYPMFDKSEEYEKWYNELRQGVADEIRRRAKSYWDREYSYQSSASEKQIAFIKKNCPDMLTRFADKDGKLSKTEASIIISDYIDYKSK